MKTTTILFCVLLFVSFGCLTRSQGGLETERIAILSVSDDRNKWYPENDPLYAESLPTELSKAELSQLDSLLIVAINQVNNERSLNINIEKYYRQYVPVMTTEKQKIVFVNCHCQLTSDEWFKFLQTDVRDGGECYFMLKINLSELKSYGMLINGHA